MALISYVPAKEIPERHRVSDSDNILRIHGIHPEVMRLHSDLFVELMLKRGPLSHRQREMIALAVSAVNGCHY